jgi:hypothetical protein
MSSDGAAAGTETSSESVDRDALRWSGIVGIAIPIVIAVVSIMGSVVSWRASVASSSAADIERIAAQQALQRAQLDSGFRGLVAHDRSILPRYQQHLKAAIALSAAARRERRRNAAAAETLYREAARERTLARSLSEYFLSTGSDRGRALSVDENGDVEYRPAKFLRYLRETSTEFQALSSARLVAEAGRRRDRATSLVAIAAIFVGSLFFLTLAQLGGGYRRLGFAAAGAAIFAVGLGWYAAVGL